MSHKDCSIKKGSIFFYRLYDVAHEIQLNHALSLLDETSNKEAKRYSLKKPTGLILRDAPIMVSLPEETFSLKINDFERFFSFSPTLKIWGYGVFSLSFRYDIPENTPLDELILLSSAINQSSHLDEVSVRLRDEFRRLLEKSLKTSSLNPLFEDYTTYLIEDMEVNGGRVSDPLIALNEIKYAELLLGEPKKKLSNSTKKHIRSHFTQYTRNDLLLMDFDAALVMDFGKEKEYFDYVDILEFSLAQLLELRIYDQLLDEKLDELYDSMEKGQFNKVTEFYTKLSEESGQLFMEFSDVFEKLDNSIKTAGDFYLARILKNADERFGFDLLKKTMSRKIEALSELSRMCQDKVDALIDQRRNELAEISITKSHRMEMIVILLISIEALPALKDLLLELLNLVGI